MTSTDSSTSNNNTNQNNSTSEPSAALDLSSKAAMTNETSNESQQSIDSSSPEARPQENTNHSDISNLNSSEASSSFSSSASPASSSSPTSTNDAPTDKTQTTNDATSSENNKASKNNNTTKQNTNNNQKKSTKNNNKSASANSSIEHSPVAQQQPNHTQFVNFYPAYVPHQVGPQNTAPNAVSYTQLDGTAPHAWPQAMAAAAMAAMADPMQIATYMNNAPNSVGPLPYQSANPSEFNQQHYDQFSFGFTPAFGFGYNGNGTIDYAALQAAQQAPHLNPQSNQWTPSANSSTTPTPSATGANTTTASATTGATTTTTNPTSSPANTTTSSNDTTSSVPSTANSETSASNSKWIQVISDPLAVNEFNVFQHHHHHQLSPGDMYTHQPQPHYNNYRSHHHYQRHHQHMQPNYHHYQYNNLYQMPHYGNQYMQNPVPQHHHYSHNKYNKYNNNYSNSSNNNSNHAGFHDNNNNSRKSNNLNNTDSTKTMKEQEMEMSEEQFEHDKSNIESKTESNGSKSWASIVGVPNNTDPSTKNASASNPQQTSRGSSPQETNEALNEQTNDTKQHHQLMSNQSENNKSTNFSSEYSSNTNGNSNYNKPKNHNYSRIRQQQNNSNNNNNIESTAQQVFDVTSLSFPPIGADIATIKAELKESSKQSNKKYENTVSLESNYNNGSNTITMNAQNFYQNSKKQQQYNNYQRHQQQQFNLPIGKFQNYQNGSINNSFNPKPAYYSNSNGTESPVQQRSERGERSEKPYKGDFYNKRHQPTQHTLSSFLNIVDKTKFNEKSKETTKQQTTATATNGTRSADACDATKTPTENSDSTFEHLAEQTVNLHIEQPQLVVYTNPSAYNPKEFNTSPKAARFFVIKSYSEDDIHRSIKYNIWCSTEHGNRRLDSAYFKGDAQVPVYLFFSVNGSGHFCGMAEMQSRVDYNKKTGVWSQDKWRGCFQVKWIYVKDVPNSLLRNIKLENNDNKPVTNSRDTQEIPYDKGRQVLKVFHTYSHSSSILDDFEHYERKQEEGKAILKAPHNNYEQGDMNFVEKPEYIQQSVNNGETSNGILQDMTVDQPKQDTQDTTVSSPSTSSSSSTSSIDESKQEEQQSSSSKPIEQVQTSTQLISSSS